MASQLFKRSGSSPTMDESGTYRMRAFNNGRFLETELKLLGSGKGIAWGFALGQNRTTSMMQITEKGDWTEITEITIRSEAPKKYMELSVSRQKYLGEPTLLN